MTTRPTPRPMTVMTPALRRRNLILAWTLLVFACSLAMSVFVWRYAHHQPAIPQGGSYGATYEIQR